MANRRGSCYVADVLASSYLLKGHRAPMARSGHVPSSMSVDVWFWLLMVRKVKASVGLFVLCRRAASSPRRPRPCSHVVVDSRISFSTISFAVV